MRVIGEQRIGDINLNTGSNGQTVVEETYTYIVEADSKFDSRLLVSQCPGLPQVGISLSASGLAKCKSISGSRREENPRIWDFTCNFSSEVNQDNQTDTTGTGTDPETWVPIRRTLFEKIETQEYSDRNGKVFATSANEPFAEGITRVRFLPVWEFDQFESATVSDEDIVDRNEKINNSTYKSFPRHTLLIRVVDSVIGFYYGQRRRLTKYRITYNFNTWDLKILDKGEWYLDANKKRTPFTTDNTIGKTDWVGFLDGKGGKLTFKDPQNPQPDEFVYRTFRMYDRISFSSFLRF